MGRKIKKIKNCSVCGESSVEKFYKNVKHLCKKHYIEYARVWQKDNMLQFRLLSAKNRARKSNLEFTITLADLENLLIKQNNKCYYTGKEFINEDPDWTVSIDRIDSTKGYTLDNIRLISSATNYMKSDVTEEMFYYLISLIKHNRNLN